MNVGNYKIYNFAGEKERCSSGLRGTPGERVYPKRVSWVRIPLSPHHNSNQNV